MNREKAFGLALVAVGVVLSLLLWRTVAAYLGAEHKMQVDATLVSTVENERLDRKTKEYETYYENTYRFDVEGDTQEWTEISEHVGSETRHLRLYLDSNGTWQHFELGRDTLLAIACVVLGIVLVVLG